MTRRNTPREEIAKHLEAFKASGLKVSEYAAQHNIDVKNFYNWLSAEKRGKFNDVKVAQITLPPQRSTSKYAVFAIVPMSNFKDALREFSQWS